MRLVATLCFLLIAAACSDSETTTAPLVFECTQLDAGQSLTATGTVDGNVVTLMIESNNGTFRAAPLVDNVMGATVGERIVVDGVIQIELENVSGTVTFDFGGRLIGPQGDFCDVARSYTVNATNDGVTVD